MPTMRPKWYTEDGAVFDTETEALAHERAAARVGRPGSRRPTPPRTLRSGGRLNSTTARG